MGFTLITPQSITGDTEMTTINITICVEQDPTVTVEYQGPSLEPAEEPYEFPPTRNEQQQIRQFWDDEISPLLNETHAPKWATLTGGNLRTLIATYRRPNGRIIHKTVTITIAMRNRIVTAIENMVKHPQRNFAT